MLTALRRLVCRHHWSEWQPLPLGASEDDGDAISRSVVNAIVGGEMEERSCTRCGKSDTRVA